MALRARLRRAAAVVACALLAAACARRGPAAASRASVVALVGDRPVELPELAAYVKGAAGEELKDVSPRVASSLLDQYLEELLLARAVEDAQPPVKGATPEERRRDLISRVARLDTIGEADLRAEYDAHAERFRRPAVLRVSQLFFSSREKADAAVKKLAEKVPWLEVSRQLSSAPNAATGGSLGLLSRSDVPRDFEKAIWGLPEGASTAVLGAPHGFHVFRVEERLEERLVPFEEAMPALRLELAEERSAAAAAEVLAGARKAHPPSVVEEHLPFPYVGTTARFSLDSRP